MKKPKSLTTPILAGVALVTAIGGGAWSLDERWARKPWVQERFTEVDLRSYERERDSVADKIAEYRIRRATARPDVRQIIDAEIEKLTNRLNSLNQTIYQLRERGKR